MKLIETWLGDASSLWLSLGALMVIALLVVLMFNAFQGRARRAKWSSPSTDEPVRGSDASAPESRASARERVEPRFSSSNPLDPSPRASGDQSGPLPGTRQAGDRADDLTDPSALAALSIDERFPPDMTDDAPDLTTPQALDDDRDALTMPPSGAQGRLPPGQGTKGSGPPGAVTRPGVTARRLSGASVPVTAEWGGLDERIDCIALMQLQPPVDCIALRSGAQTFARIGTKSVIAEVQLADGSWSDVRAAEGHAGALRLGILLANRQGPLSAAEFAEFAEKLRRLAAKLEVKDIRLPETMGVLERARQVDEFCARLDTLIGVNVLASSRIAPTRVAELAQMLELVPRGHQKYARSAASGDVLFTMLQAERADMLTFLLDVPRASSAEEPWIRMVEAARHGATLLEAQLVDDALAPLSEAAVQAVARQLQSHYAQLESAGLNAGSAAALRVFN